MYPPPLPFSAAAGLLWELGVEDLLGLHQHLQASAPEEERDPQGSRVAPSPPLFLHSYRRPCPVGHSVHNDPLVHPRGPRVSGNSPSCLGFPWFLCWDFILHSACTNSFKFRSILTYVCGSFLFLPSTDAYMIHYTGPLSLHWDPSPLEFQTAWLLSLSFPIGSRKMMISYSG